MNKQDRKLSVLKGFLRIHSINDAFIVRGFELAAFVVIALAAKRFFPDEVFRIVSIIIALIVTIASFRIYIALTNREIVKNDEKIR